MLEIELPKQPPSYVPGTSLDVTVRWQVDDQIDWLELRLVCNTSGKGDRDLQIVQTWKLSPVRRTGSESVTLDLPQAPYSFSGKLISLIWALELLTFPGDQSTRQEIVIAPNATEVLLSSAEQ